MKFKAKRMRAIPFVDDAGRTMKNKYTYEEIDGEVLIDFITVSQQSLARQPFGETEKVYYQTFSSSQLHRNQYISFEGQVYRIQQTFPTATFLVSKVYMEMM